VLLNMRVNQLTGKVERMDEDMHRIDERLIRLETLVKFAANRMTIGRE
jgi:hypothetical protein